jgi:hypothetical protein
MGVKIKRFWNIRTFGNVDATLVNEIKAGWLQNHPDCYPILSLQHKVQAKGRSQERIHATPDEVAEEN